MLLIKQENGNNINRVTCDHVLVRFTQGSNTALNACVIAPPAGNITSLLCNTGQCLPVGSLCKTQ